MKRVNNNFVLTLFSITLFSITFFFHGFSAIAKPLELLIVTENLPPYQQINKDGTIGGFSTEIVNELLELTGIAANIKMMSWARAYNIARHQKNVLIYSISKTEKRKNKFIWLGDLLQEKVCFWSLKSNEKVNKYPPKTEDDLKNSTFVDTRLSFTSDYLLKHGFKKIHLTSSDTQSLAMLLANRADYILTTEYYLNIETKKVNADINDFQRVLKNTSLITPLSIAFSRKTDPDIIKKFRQAFKVLKEKGTLETAIKKWRLKELSPHC